MSRRARILFFGSVLSLGCEPPSGGSEAAEGEREAEPSALYAEDSASASYPAPPMTFSSAPTASASAAAVLEVSRCPAEPPVLLRRPTLSDEALRQAMKDKTALLGAASLGEPNKGNLFAGVELKANEHLERSGKHGFGTELTVRSLERAAREVARCHPGGPKVHVGDISAERGGWITPHRSHQSGLDADVGFYYRTGSAWYVAPTREMLDIERTWTFLRALIEGGGVEVVFLDLRIQRMLHDVARAAPPQGWKLENVFDLEHHKDKLLRHEYGHATHLHVRFSDPWARSLGARVVALDPTGALRGAPKRVKR